MITIHEDKESIERRQMQQLKQRDSIRFLPALIKTPLKRFLHKLKARPPLHRGTPPSDSKPMNKISNTRSLAALITLALPLLPFTPSAGQEKCAFNGNWESCKIYRYTNNGVITARKVIWLSDGKGVTYYEYNCSASDDYTGQSQCKAKIVEDNGRVTYGVLYHNGGRGIRIRSDRGNVTDLPP